MSVHRLGPCRPRLPPYVTGRLPDRLDPETGERVRVLLVDGCAVRDEGFIEFTMGDNEFHGPKLCPRGAILIDDCLGEKDREATARHEMEERVHMRRGMKYGPAHERANLVERAYRRRG